MSTTLRTPLFAAHTLLSAKMAPFGGWDMPIQYTGIIKEHEAVRTGVGIFDTCHMGEFMISGDNAQADLEQILSCPIADLALGSCRYGFICNEKGGTIDDQVIYRLAADRFMMVVNAGTRPADFAWIQDHVSPQTKVEDISDATGKLDIQGPGAAKIMNALLEKPVSDLRFYTFMMNSWKGIAVTVSRTGYTGELGFEIYVPADRTEEFWNDCLALGVTPCGLGCRDTLRLEMGMPLYGHELNPARNPAEMGFLKAIGSNKVFIGSKTVLDVSQRNQKMVAIVLEGRRAARADDVIYAADEKTKIGIITSGSFSPSLKGAIALGYVKTEYAALGTKISILVDKQKLPAAVAALPFYKDATGRKDMAAYL